MSQLEYCNCPLCGAAQAEDYLIAPDRFALAEGRTYSLQRCRRCSMVYLNPRPREVDSGRYYQHAEYLPFASVAAPRSLLERVYAGLRRLNLRWKKKLIGRFHARGSLLDVGCGTGELLAFMREAGWQVRGLERDAAAAEWGRSSLQLPIQTGSVDELKEDTVEYDVITMWHVLEHVYSPHAALHILRQRLQNDGVLIIAVPNIASVDAKFYERHWIALDVPRHVNHFSLETLVLCAAQEGFTLSWWQQLPLDAFFNTLMSERLQAECNASSRWLWPFRVLRAGCATLATLIAGGNSPFVTERGGATIVAVFRKAEKSSQRYQTLKVW